MEPGPPDSKRPRLATGPPSLWSTSGQLPPPQTSGPHHPSPPGPYLPPFSRPPSDPHQAHHSHHHHDDRRHHEPVPDLYPPMQEHHRQPSQISLYPPHQDRDISVKRDPAEQPPPLPPHQQTMRHNSNGTGPDPPLTPIGPPPPHLEDQRRYGFDTVPQSPALGYRGHSHHFPHRPPSPMSHASQYGEPPGPHYNPNVGPSPSDIYAPVSISSTAKRKPQRASQACDSCRSLKAKCDEQRPCKNCKEKNIACNYRETQTKPVDKMSTDMMDILLFLKDSVTSEFADIKTRLSRLEGRENVPGDDTLMKLESGEETNPHVDQPPTPTAQTNSEDGTQQIDDEKDARLREAQRTIQQTHVEEMELVPGSPIDVGQPYMHSNHTTLASYLLEWKPVRELVGDILEQEILSYPTEYPIRQEVARGVLRVFGRGEGVDQDLRPPNRDGHSINPTMTDYPAGEILTDVASPAAQGDAWGQVGGTPSDYNYKGGTLTSEGTPDFTPSTVRRYVQSFKTNILNMHPILIPAELDALVTLFLDTLPSQHSKHANRVAAPAAKFVTSGGAMAPSVPLLETGTKRKRSPVAEDAPYSAGAQRPGRPFRSIHSAIVLLVIALGKICLHKTKIPDVVHEQESTHQGSPSVRNGIPVPASPLQGSPPGLPPSQSSGLPSPRENIADRSGHRRPSLQGPATVKSGHSMRRNYEAIPGLEYFGMATDIIGSHIGGANLKHVYAFIFAGLYHGQLGRIFESWAYINLASRTLHVIIRSSAKRLGSMPNGIIEPRDNQLVYAFWTCLQLESDILAELPVPQSQILPYEKIMPFPNLAMSNEQGHPPEVVFSYTAQLYLRKQLNRIHALFYGPDGSVVLDDDEDGIPCHTMEQRLHAIQRKLNPTSQWVPKCYAFGEKDLPARDLLSARLRAKYYGSQVIAYRPFLRMILDPEGALADRLPPFSTPPPPPSEWRHFDIDVGGMGLPAGVDPRAVNYARLAIEALIESTRAFHGLEKDERYIVTNVFGTAHAQWGNLIVLAACYGHNILCRFIDERTLSELYARTIKFFELIAVPSSPLMIDLNILKGIAEKLGFPSTSEAVSSSFSSVVSNTPFPPPPVQRSPEGYSPANSYSPATPINTMPPPPHSMA